MKTFEYRGLDPRGRARRGLVEAGGPKEARERLAADGILADKITVTGRRIRLSAAQRAVIYRELGALLGAGLPLVSALDVLIDAPEVKEARLCLAGLRDRVREGTSLAEGMADSSSSVTAFERAMIDAAERSATVDAALEQLANVLDERERVRQRVQAALIYPAIVVGVGLCVAMLMLGLLVPRARELLQTGPASLPVLTTFMIRLGDYAMYAVVPLAVLMAAVTIALRRRLGTDEAFRQRWDRWRLSVPLVGGGYALLVSERFCRTLALLLRGGVPLVEGIVLAGQSTGSAWVAACSEAAAEAVRHGEAFSQAVGRIPPLAVALSGWLRVGEAGADLPRLLQSASERFAARWDRFVTTRLALLEPVLILIIGAFVLLVTLAILLPVLQLSRSV